MGRFVKAGIVLIPAIVYLVIRELLFEIVFGSAVDWIRDRDGVVVDFIAWRWSSLLISVILLALTGLVVAYWDNLSQRLPVRV